MSSFKPKITINLDYSQSLIKGLMKLPFSPDNLNKGVSFDSFFKQAKQAKQDFKQLVAKKTVYKELYFELNNTDKNLFYDKAIPSDLSYKEVNLSDNISMLSNQDLPNAPMQDDNLLNKSFAQDGKKDFKLSSNILNLDLIKQDLVQPSDKQEWVLVDEFEIEKNKYLFLPDTNQPENQLLDFNFFPKPESELSLTDNALVTVSVIKDIPSKPNQEQLLKDEFNINTPYIYKDIDIDLMQESPDQNIAVSLNMLDSLNIAVQNLDDQTTKNFTENIFASDTEVIKEERSLYAPSLEICQEDFVGPIYSTIPLLSNFLGEDDSFNIDLFDSSKDDSKSSSEYLVRSSYKEKEIPYVFNMFDVSEDLKLIVSTEHSLVNDSYFHSDNLENNSLKELEKKFFIKHIQANSDKNNHAKTTADYAVEQQNHSNLDAELLNRDAVDNFLVFDYKFALKKDLGGEFMSNVQQKSSELRHTKYDTNQLKITLKEKMHLLLEDHFRSMINKGFKSAEIRLDPPALGSIYVRLNLDNNKINHISFFTANEATKNLIESTVNSLRYIMSTDLLRYSNPIYFKDFDRNRKQLNSKKSNKITDADSSKRKGGNKSDGSISLYV